MTSHSLELDLFFVDKQFLVSLLSSALVGLIIYLYYWNKNAHTFWEKRGVRGPKPWPLVGNYIELIVGDRMSLQTEWPQQYGKLYGIYLGSRPVLCVTDPEILQLICIKEHETFANHDVPEFLNQYHKSFIFFQQDEHWARLRALMSPTFTSSKVRRMYRLLSECADDLLDCFGERLSSSPNVGSNTKRAIVDVKEIYSLFTLDTISSCCYGLKLDRPSKGGTASSTRAPATTVNRQDFVRLAQSLLEEQMWRLLLAIAGPKALLRRLNFRMFEQSRFDKLAELVQRLVERRRKSPRKLEDYLQILIDAKLEHQLELDEMDSLENHHANLTRESLLSDQDKLVHDARVGDASSASLDEHEIVTNAMLLLLVGLETTASMLATCCHLLAFNAEIQEKLFAEIAKIAECSPRDEGSHQFGYEALTSCRYLDAVISETLRFLTPVFSLDRVASRHYRFEKYNLDIPKGCLVSLAYYAAMNDPDHWREPQKFQPERFMPANKERIVPGSYCPFGLGPRHCLGMRFGLTEAKLALAKTIMKYRFEPLAGAKFPPKLSKRIDMVHVEDARLVLVARQ